MKSHSQQREDIRSRCESVKKALNDCPNAGLLSFFQRIGEIENAAATIADQDLHGLDSQLDALIKELQATEDAHGEKILGWRRWEKFM